MSPSEQSHFSLEGVREKIQQKRKQVIRYNLRLFVFLLFMLAGLVGSVYYYQKQKSTNKKLESANQQLEKAKRMVDAQNRQLDSINRALSMANQKLKAQEEKLVTVIDAASHSARPKEVLKPVVAARDSAREYARLGYRRLKQKDFHGAWQAFDKSENFYNGYRQSYEISFLLRKNREKWSDPATQSQLLQTIYKQYNSLQILTIADIR